MILAGPELSQNKNVSLQKYSGLNQFCVKILMYG